MTANAPRPSNHNAPSPTSRNDWLKACSDAQRAMKGGLDRGHRDALRDALASLAGCGSSLGVLVCAHCGRSQPGSGDLVSAAARGLCGLAGCPLCHAEDRALRAHTLVGGFVASQNAATREARRIKGRLKTAARKAARGGRLRAPQRGWTVGAPAQLARIQASRWFTYEVVRRYDQSATPQRLLERLTLVAKGFHSFTAALWRECLPGDGIEHDVSAFGAWVEPPADGQVLQRGVFFGPEVSHEEFKRVLRREARHAKLVDLGSLRSAPMEARARFLAGDPLHKVVSASFAERWLNDRPCTVPGAHLALLWSMAMSDSSWARSDGLLCAHYRPITDDTRPIREATSDCLHCEVEGRFREEKRTTQRYLDRCREFSRAPFATRKWPAESDAAEHKTTLKFR